ncbi:MAG: ATP cone domain-containing protein [Bacteroidales bacterium]
MTVQESQVNVKKNTGELEPFDPEKLINALQRSGAGKHEIDAVMDQVTSSLYEGITTKKIYQLAYRILSKISKRTAGRYRLKKALYQLGPSGFPFEFFVARLLEFEGYTVQTGQSVQGKCVTHEVDVVARHVGKLLMAECKFHNSNTAKSDVKVSLYVHARFRDIRENHTREKENKGIAFESLLITNTRFTSDAVQYGKCTGMKLISWDYPGGKGLRDWIDRAGFHPITAMKSLTNREKKKLLNKGIVLCREIAENPFLMDELAIPERRLKAIIKEAGAMI